TTQEENIRSLLDSGTGDARRNAAGAAAFPASARIRRPRCAGASVAGGGDTRDTNLPRARASKGAQHDGGLPMKYLCLVYLDEKNLHSVADSECKACGDALRQSGHHIAAEALASVDTATTVRVRNGKVSVTDGPFAETKEQLAGVYLIEAKDLNEAIQVASKIPPAHVGSIEVRPVMTLNAN